MGRHVLAAEVVKQWEWFIQMPTTFEKGPESQLSSIFCKDSLLYKDRQTVLIVSFISPFRVCDYKQCRYYLLFMTLIYLLPTEILHG